MFLCQKMSSKIERLIGLKRNVNFKENNFVMKKLLLFTCLLFLFSCSKESDGYYYVYLYGNSEYPYNKNIMVKFEFFPVMENKTYKTQSFLAPENGFSSIKLDEIMSNLNDGVAILSDGSKVKSLYSGLTIPNAVTNSLTVKEGKYWVMCYPIDAGSGVDYQYKTQLITVNNHTSLYGKFKMNFDTYGYTDWDK